MQKHYCKACNKYQQQDYIYQACKPLIIEMLPKLVCESVSIRRISRLLKISTATVIKKIKLIALKIIKSPVPMHCRTIELDEVRTFIKKKENHYWIAYAMCSETKRVIDFVTGKRTKRTLKMIVNTLLLTNVEIIKRIS